METSKKLSPQLEEESKETDRNEKIVGFVWLPFWERHFWALNGNEENSDIAAAMVRGQP